MLVSCALLSAAYSIGAIPFGYLIGRMRGVDLFREGSGNIGATNAGRVLGRGFGILVFLLDFLKGALPVAAIVPLARLLDPEAPTAFEGVKCWAKLQARHWRKFWASFRTRCRFLDRTTPVKNRWLAWCHTPTHPHASRCAKL